MWFEIERIDEGRWRGGRGMEVHWGKQTALDLFFNISVYYLCVSMD